MISINDEAQGVPTEGFLDGGGRLAVEPRPFQFGMREHAINFGFWTLFGAVTAATFMSDDFGGSISGYPPLESLYWFLRSYLWAVVTPLVFWLVWRFYRYPARRNLNLLLMATAGLGIIAVVTVIGNYLCDHMLNLSHHRGPARAGGFGFDWHDLTDEPIMFAAIFGAGFAREYLLRNAARHEQAVKLRAHAAEVEARAAQLQSQLAKARLSVLRSQLNPHFLFNTLNALSALMQSGPPGVHTIIARLSELMRYALDGEQQEEIPLSEEFRLTGLYLEILEIRFQGRLATEMTFGPGTHDALVPNLILQPIVENAMKHGVGKAGGRGRIEVESSRDGQFLVLTVKDTGGGGRAGGPAELDSAATGTGVGLRNTTARLRELYGRDQSLSLLPLPEGGTIVTITLPYRLAAAPHPEAVLG